LKEGFRLLKQRRRYRRRKIQWQEEAQAEIRI